ncbi:MAG: hypothetical protein ACYDA3_05550 [Gaiellaceae bacterium]
MLRLAAVRALVAAQLVSNTGTQMTFLTPPWFVLVTTGSAYGARATYLAIAAGLAAMAVLYALVVLRHGDEPAFEPVASL